MCAVGYGEVQSSVLNRPEAYTYTGPGYRGAAEGDILSIFGESARGECNIHATRPSPLCVQGWKCPLFEKGIWALVVQWGRHPTEDILAGLKTYVIWKTAYTNVCMYMYDSVCVRKYVCVYACTYRCVCLVCIALYTHTYTYSNSEHSCTSCGVRRVSVLPMIGVRQRY